MLWLRVLCSAGSVALSGAATVGVGLALLPRLGGWDYYGLLAMGHAPRLALLGLLGAVLARGAAPRSVARLALALGVGSAVVAGGITTRVVLAARSMGLRVTLEWPRLPCTTGQDGGPGLPEVVTLAASDGWALVADLHRPPAGAPQTNGASIVVVHGGAWRHGDKGENPFSNRWLAQRGYLVLDVQYRLAPVAHWRIPVGDIRAAVTWLREHAAELGIDAERVVLLGRSAGGHLALLAGFTTNDADPPAAVIAFYAPSDLAQLYFESFTAPGGQDVRDGLRALLGTAPGARDARYKAASPISHVGPDGPRTLLVHGTWDTSVSAAHSQRLAAALAAQGADVQLVEVPCARHAFDIVADGLATRFAHEAVAAFLAR